MKQRMKKRLVALFITIAVLGISTNSFLYVMQAGVIKNDQAFILSLQNELAGNNDQLTLLNEALQNIDTNVSGITSSVSNLQNDVTSAKDGIASLNGNVEAVRTVVLSLSSSVSKLQQSQSAGSGLTVDFSSATNKVKPCVVVIEVQIVTTIFGRRVIQQGAGSGWIVSSNGYIATNSHVVADAVSIRVTLADGRSFPSVGVQTDPASDLAIVKIDANNLPAATVGDSGKLQVGQPVSAIGNALGLGINMTGGWVSRLNTSITFSDGSRLTGLIGTDAAINPGNSGGPLININGEVIGITNAKLVEIGVEGIGYAININSAITTLNSLMARF